MRPKDQGTAEETATVDDFLFKSQVVADRLAEGGSTDLGDVWAVIHPQYGEAKRRVALRWKRLIGDGPRRKPDGERIVYVIDRDFFHELIASSDLDFSLIVEVKARQTLNVTRELFKAKRKAQG